MTFSFERFANSAITTLNGSISSVDTALTVTDETNFPTAPFRIIIESEIILVTSTSGPVFTVTRGQEGTSADIHMDGAKLAQIITKQGFFNLSEDPSIVNARLSFSSVDPTPYSASGTDVYAVPYQGNRVALLDPVDSHWRLNEVGTGVVLSLGSFPSGSMVDVFMYYDESTKIPKLEGTAWSSITARTGSGELTTQDGVTVRLDDPTRRYMGTVLTHETGYSISNPRRRFLWNKYNKVPMELSQQHLFTSYTYAVAVTRNMNASAEERVEYIVGQSGEGRVELEGGVSVYSASTGTNQFTIGFGINSASFNGKKLGMGWGANNTSQITAKHYDNPDKGYYYAQMLENSPNSVSATVYGASTNYKNGIDGTIFG